VIDLIWKYYVDYYFVLTPTFWQENWQEKNVEILIKRLIKLPYFVKDKVKEEGEEGEEGEGDEEGEKGDYDEDNQYNNFKDWVKERNIKKISRYILYDCDEICLPYILSLVSSTYKGTIQQIINKVIGCNIRLLYLYGIKIKLREDELEMRDKDKDKNKDKDKDKDKDEEFQIIIKPKPKKIKLVIVEVDDYTTITNIKPNKVLKMMRKYSIDEYGFLSLFSMRRDMKFVQECYFYDWLYYASFPPIWKSRIEKYKGKYNNDLKKIEFNEEEEEKFYDEFNYEPDEQPIEVEQKHTINTGNSKWIEFYKKLKCN